MKSLSRMEARLKVLAAAIKETRGAPSRPLGQTSGDDGTAGPGG